MITLPCDTLPVPANALGESPVWHRQELALYWVDIPQRQLHRWDWASATHRLWQLDEEPGCVAPIDGGGVLLAQRSGLYRLDTTTGQRWSVAPAPYDTATQRFNDGKVDPWGRFWVGTIYEPRDQPLAVLYRLGRAGLEAVWPHGTVSNGLAWSPDGATQYWSDTWGHALYRSRVDGDGNAAPTPTLWRRFAHKTEVAAPAVYAGRPDGGAVDAQGRYWSAMFEGARLVCFADTPQQQDLHYALPVQCPTMPCFAGPELDTLVITTARYQRSAEELRQMPLAGHVLLARAPVRGTCPPLLDPHTLPTP